MLKQIICNIRTRKSSFFSYIFRQLSYSSYDYITHQGGVCIKNEVIIFENENIKLDVNICHDTVWLTQQQIAKLFNRNKSVISRHINSILKNELEKETTVALFATVQKEGKRKVIRKVEHTTQT